MTKLAIALTSDIAFYLVNNHMIAWVIYGVLLWGNFKQGWRGRLTVYVTIIGTSLLTLAYFGSRFVKEFLLS
jgi:ABC-type uncharacterized transport system permease subunit